MPKSQDRFKGPKERTSLHEKRKKIIIIVQERTRTHKFVVKIPHCGHKLFGKVQQKLKYKQNILNDTNTNKCVVQITWPCHLLCSYCNILEIAATCFLHLIRSVEFSSFSATMSAVYKLYSVSKNCQQSCILNVIIIKLSIDCFF